MGCFSTQAPWSAVTGLKSATVYGVQVDAIVWDKSGTTKTMAVKETAATNCAAASLAMTGPRSGLGPLESS